VYVAALVHRDRDSNGDQSITMPWCCGTGTATVMGHWTSACTSPRTATMMSPRSLTMRATSSNATSMTRSARRRSSTPAGMSWRPAPSPGSTCIKAAGSTPRAACITSGSVTTRRPSAAGRASTRSATPPATSTFTGVSRTTLSLGSILRGCYRQIHHSPSMKQNGRR